MSRPVTERVSCPSCGAQHSLTLWASVNTRESPELKRALLAGELFRFACKRCRHETLLAFDTLYHDPDRKLMIWLKYPDEYGLSRVNPAADGLFELLGEDYTFRIVSSANGLVEKVRIFDDGYDDIAIELLKALVSFVQKLDLTSPLYYSKTKKRLLGGPQIVLIEPTSDDGWVERECSVGLLPETCSSLNESFYCPDQRARRLLRCRRRSVVVIRPVRSWRS